MDYEKSVCKDCSLNMGYMPCCDKVYCKVLGTTEAKESCEYRKGS